MTHPLCGRERGKANRSQDHAATKDQQRGGRQPCRTLTNRVLKGPKRHQAVSGYWHTLTTLAHYCRGRSYLVSARNHGVRSINAIHDALNGNPWLPTISTA
jgi:hypothetical protein